MGINVASNVPSVPSTHTELIKRWKISENLGGKMGIGRQFNYIGQTLTVPCYAIGKAGNNYNDPTAVVRRTKRPVLPGTTASVPRRLFAALQSGEMHTNMNERYLSPNRFEGLTVIPIVMLRIGT